jgi:hypothetical protein
VRQIRLKIFLVCVRARIARYDLHDVTVHVTERRSLYSSTTVRGHAYELALHSSLGDFWGPQLGPITDTEDVSKYHARTKAIKRQVKNDFGKERYGVARPPSETHINRGNSLTSLTNTPSPNQN